MKKRLILISAIIFFLIITSLLCAPFFINVLELKSGLEQSISQKINADFKAKTAKISFLPLPKISLSDVAISKFIVDEEYYSDIKVKNLIIKPALFSLFGKKIEINNLTFENPEIENHHNSKNQSQELPKDVEKNKANTANIPNSFFSFSNNKEAFDFKNIKSIEFKNGYFVKRSLEKEVEIEFRNINFSLKNNLARQIFTIEGAFLSEEEPTSFILTINAKNKEKSSLIIQSEIINLSLSGNFSNSYINNLAASNFIGKIDVKIFDLKAFLSKYVSKNNLLYRKINSTQPIQIIANIENKAGEVDISDISINSSLMEGSGKISANLIKDRPTILANLDFKNIDIDGIWFSGAINNSSNLINSENEIIQEFLNQTSINFNDENKSYLINSKQEKAQSDNSFFGDLDLNAKIKIKTAKYYNENLQNLSLNFITNDNNLFLEPLLAEIPGSGLLKISGFLEHQGNNEIPKFSGKIEINGKNLQKSLAWLGIDTSSFKPQILNDYKFNADLLILPSYNFFNNLNLSVNDNKNIITGSLKVDDSSGISNKIADLRINYFNYDDYFLSTKLDRYFSSGSLLKKLLWLNTIGSNSDISFLFDQFIYQGNIFNNESFKIKFGQGYFKLFDLKFSSPSLDIKGNLEIDISNNNPKIDINLSSNNFRYHSPQKDSKKNQFFPDLFFNIPAIDEFSGVIDINVKNFNIDSWQANDLLFKGEVKNGIINFDNFSLKTYGGEAKYKGEMVLKNIKTINGSIELVGVDGGLVLRNLLNINNISGITNLSAIVNSSAQNQAEFLKNLNASGQFIGANIAVKGFGIYDLAVKMAQAKKYQEALNKPENILYNSETVSSFKDISGAFAIKKNNPDQFNIQASSLGINGVISGEFDAENQTFDSNANFIFISGSRQNQIPINFAVNFKGKAGEIQKSNNFTQIEQYLKSRLTPQ